MLAAKVILFERGDTWRRALRVLGGDMPHIVETRSIAECRAELEEAKASVLGLELTARDWVDIVELLRDLPTITPMAAAALFVSPDDAEVLPAAEWQLLQAGARLVVSRRRRVGEFARFAREHLRQIDRLRVHSSAEIPYEQRVREELPL